MGLAILMAAIMATPLLFQHFWFQRWFRVCWWIAIFMIMASVLRSRAQSPLPNLDTLENSLMNEYVACVRKSANVLDDGKSDASTIAVAAEEQCWEERVHLVEFEGRTVPADQYSTFKQKMDQMMLSGDIRIVLMARKDRADWDEAMSKLATPAQ